MGLYNILDDVPVSCPVCGRTFIESVQFKAGPCNLHHYQLGQTLDWSKEGPLNMEEARGQGRIECDVLISACSFCVRKYAAQYKAIRRLLVVSGRLENFAEPPEELTTHPEPNQQDGFFYVDGIYRAAEWIAFELTRLDAPVVMSFAMWNTKLIIKNDVLSEVLPATMQPTVWTFSSERAKTICEAHTQLRSEMLRLLAYQDDEGRAVYSDRMIELCRSLEFAESFPELSAWAMRNASNILSRDKQSPGDWRALAANLNLLIVHRDSRAAKELKVIGVNHAQNALGSALLVSMPEVVAMRVEKRIPVRLQLHFKENSANVSVSSFEIRAGIVSVSESAALPALSDEQLPPDPRSSGRPFQFPPPSS